MECCYELFARGYLAGSLQQPKDSSFFLVLGCATCPFDVQSRGSGQTSLQGKQGRGGSREHILRAPLFEKSQLAISAQHAIQHSLCQLLRSNDIAIASCACIQDGSLPKHEP
jgi:hypothetical protein